MGLAGLGPRQESLVMSDEDAALATSVDELPVVFGVTQAYALRHRHVDAAATQSVGDGWGHVFVEVEADLGRHSWPVCLAGSFEGCEWRIASTSARSSAIGASISWR